MKHRKGDPVNGWLVIDKPEGMGSTEVVNLTRRLLNAQKNGHTGTLDPFASGILPIAFGETTKLIDFLGDETKEYEFTVQWGTETDSADSDGSITADNGRIPTDEEILAVLPQFCGEITQTPPAFCAVKINGRRAYELARKGEEVNIPERQNMQLIKTLFPKLRIVARGNVMKVIGDEDESELFLKKIREVEKYCEEFNSLSEDVILDIIKGKGPTVVKQENLIIHGMNGKPITARTENQQLLVKAFENNDLVFATGPAGSGKTFVAIALAVKALKNKEVRKIILSRPAVEAGEKLGFLPGEMKDKLDPYLQPLYDALQDMIPAAKLKEYMENNVIQIAPLAFMRGRTLILKEPAP